MCWLISGQVDGVPLNILKKNKNITKVCELVGRNPKVNEWVNKTYPKNYERVDF